jgi:hypothetical protein
MTNPWSHDADRIARGVAKNYTRVHIDALRDHCDIATGGEMDTTQLDIFVDMVESRLGHAGVKVYSHAPLSDMLDQYAADCERDD